MMMESDDCICVEDSEATTLGLFSTFGENHNSKCNHLAFIHVVYNTNMECYVCVPRMVIILFKVLILYFTRLKITQYNQITDSLSE